MRLIELEGKALLRRHGIATPRGVLLRPGEAPPAGFGAAFLKAQVAEGGRGKRGLVRRAEEPGAAESIRAALDDASPPPRARRAGRARSGTRRSRARSPRWTR